MLCTDHLVATALAVGREDSRRIAGPENDSRTQEYIYINIDINIYI